MPAPRIVDDDRPAPSSAPSAETTATPMRIGDLASRAGVSTDALRYYQQRGLLQPSGRRASGYREYAPEAVGIVHFIKHAQVLGFTLAEIDELLSLRGAAARRGTGLQVREVAVAKIADIEAKMRMLATLRAALADLVVACEQTCDADTVVDASKCPIIAALSGDGGPPIADNAASSTTHTRPTATS